MDSLNRANESELNRANGSDGIKESETPDAGITEEAGLTPMEGVEGSVTSFVGNVEVISPNEVPEQNQEVLDENNEEGRR